MLRSAKLSLKYSFLYTVLSALVFVLAFRVTQYAVEAWVLEQMRCDVLRRKHQSQRMWMSVIDTYGAG
ncbi:MAG: hypothetical protein CMI60_06225 [Parvibaculum sp.]|nr:hypothetical protein [Parvibaculum sp.]